MVGAARKRRGAAAMSPLRRALLGGGEDALREWHREQEELIAGLNDIHNEVNRRRSKRVYSLEEHFQAFHNPHLEVVGRLDVLLVVLVAAVSVSVLASNLKSRCRVLG